MFLPGLQRLAIFPGVPQAWGTSYIAACGIAALSEIAKPYDQVLGDVIKLTHHVARRFYIEILYQSVYIYTMATNVGRPLGFDPDIALEAAMQLFWTKGYEHTSMQDLLAAMGLSKSSLYQTFGSKQQLFQRCMAHYADFFAAHLRQALEAAPSGRRFIEDFLTTVLKDTRGTCNRRGCLVMNTASEFAQRDAAIAQDVTLCIGRFRDALQAGVVRAQREGNIPAERNARTLANYLVSSMSGLKTLAKSGADKATIKGIIDVVLKALE
jgi:TetR/AcrR family transcriptional repressor of nem operon